jgi:16S rRNA (guanine966-N2)-methyltransferase
MSLRIIGGYLKGRRIELPKSVAFRPSSEMLRGALFNICQFQIENAPFLDLFSGSGALGIEALSRGASFCLFVEKDRKNAEGIEKNLQALQLEQKAKVICSDALFSVKKMKQIFQIVTLDPPYDVSKEHPEQIEEILFSLVSHHLLQEKALLFFEEGFSQDHLKNPPQFSSFIHQSTRRFASSLLHHYSFCPNI